MHIRTAGPEDLDLVADLEALCFPPAEAADRETFRGRLAVYPRHFWLLMDGETAVSCVNGPCTDRPDLTDDLYADASCHREDGAWQMLFGVMTHPAHRGQGCAARLMRHVIAEARAQGRRGLVLTCKERLVPWYASFGYADEGISASVHGGAVWHAMRLAFPVDFPPRSCYTDTR